MCQMYVGSLIEVVAYERCCHISGSRERLHQSVSVDMVS